MMHGREVYPENMPNLEQAIVVTTFEARFDSAYHLLKILREAAPRVPIFVIVNGNFPSGGHDGGPRDRFLREVVALGSISPICLGSGRGLAYVLNSALKLAHADRVAVFADDCQILPNAAAGLVLDLLEDLRSADLVVLNNDMGHFGVTRRCLVINGWFNEVFTGIGWEDTDFIWRARMKRSLKVVFRSDLRIQNSGSEVGFTDIIGEKVGSKYSLVNKVLMKEIFWDFRRKGKARDMVEQQGFPRTSEPKRRRTREINPLPLEGFAEEYWHFNFERNQKILAEASKKAVARLRRRLIRK